MQITESVLGSALTLAELLALCTVCVVVLRLAWRGENIRAEAIRVMKKIRVLQALKEMLLPPDPTLPDDTTIDEKEKKKPPGGS